MAAETIGVKRKREEEDAACAMCDSIPEKPLSLTCGHVVCTEHGMPPMCPTCKAPLRKSLSRFFHENWALQQFVKYFGGYDGTNWTGQRSVYIDERATHEEIITIKGKPRRVLVYDGPYDAFFRSREKGVHRHTFDFATGIEENSPTVGIIVEVQGMQHKTSTMRKQKDRIKRAWANAFPDKVFLYQIPTWTDHLEGNEVVTEKCSITEFEERIRNAVLHARAKAKKRGLILPGPQACPSRE